MLNSIAHWNYQCTVRIRERSHTHTKFAIAVACSRSSEWMKRQWVMFSRSTVAAAVIIIRYLLVEFFCLCCCSVLIIFLHLQMCSKWKSSSSRTTNKQNKNKNKKLLKEQKKKKWKTIMARGMPVRSTPVLCRTPQWKPQQAAAIQSANSINNTAKILCNARTRAYLFNIDRYTREASSAHKHIIHS